MKRSLFISGIVLTFGLTVLSCSGGAQKISDSASGIRNDLEPIPDLVEKSKQIIWNNRKVLPYEDFKQLNRNLNAIPDRIASAIAKTDDIHSAVPNIEDKEKWFGRNLKLIAGIAIPALIIFGLWRTGLLAFIRGWLGLVTPHTATSANLAAEAIVTDTATPVQREAIAAARTDRAYDAVFRKAKNKLTKAK